MVSKNSSFNYLKNSVGLSFKDGDTSLSNKADLPRIRRRREGAVLALQQDGLQITLLLKPLNAQSPKRAARATK
jgi:hypothetical protein